VDEGTWSPSPLGHSPPATAEDPCSCSWTSSSSVAPGGITVDTGGGIGGLTLMIGPVDPVPCTLDTLAFPPLLFVPGAEGVAGSSESSDSAVALVLPFLELGMEPGPEAGGVDGVAPAPAAPEGPDRDSLSFIGMARGGDCVGSRTPRGHE
jgi:hypothetical protein